MFGYTELLQNFKTMARLDNNGAEVIDLINATNLEDVV